MIPQYMFEVIHIPQVRKHIAHYANNRIRATCAFLSVSDRQAMINHVLDVATIIRQGQSLLFCIIFHAHEFV